MRPNPDPCLSVNCNLPRASHPRRARCIFSPSAFYERGATMIYLFLLAHLVADFILQPYWLVVRKRRWDGLLIHGGIVLACMLALPLADTAALALWPAMLGITAVHIATDRWKVRCGDRVPGPPIVAFLLDQVIHVATLCAALGIALPAEYAWTQAGSPSAHLAIDAAVYVVAAFATPIAV